MSPSVSTGQADRASERTRRPRLWSVPLIVFLVTWGQSTHGKPTVSGDGPHYLMVSQSILADGDIEPDNNYHANEGRFFGADGLKPERFLATAPDGRKLPVHDIGLSVLVLPVYRAALAVSASVPTSLTGRARMTQGLLAYSLVCLFMLAMTAIGWWLVAGALSKYLQPWRAVLLVLIFALAPPVMANGSALFPEVPALLIVSMVIDRAFGRRRVPLPLVMLAVGAMPWLHRKYFPMALALFALLALRDEQWLRLGQRRRWALAVLASVPLASLGIWTALTWGSLGGPLVIGRVPLSLEVFLSGSLGMFFDREFGIVAWAPAAVLLPLAFAAAGRNGLLLVLPLACLYLPSAAHDQWWGGWGPVGRFLVPAAPLAALAVGMSDASRWPRVLPRLLVGLQLVITLAVWQRPRLLWNFGDGHNRLLEAVPLVSVVERVFPSFRTQPVAWAGGLAWLVGVILLTAIALRLPKKPSERIASRGSTS